MRVGVPKEIKNHEYRVGLTPGSVGELVAAGHELFVETGAGGGIDCPDAAFRKAGATVIGMSADDVPTLQRFSSEKCAGKFAVASAGPKVIAGYNVSLGKQMAGRDITKRTSYVIGRNGRIAFVHDNMDASGHVEETLAAVQKLKS